MKRSDKKGSVFLLSTTMFIVLNILFFVLLMVFVFRASTGALIYEQTFAKQIALLADAAEPGMKIQVNVTKLSDLAKDNNYGGDIVALNGVEHSVDVRVDYDGGYRQVYFAGHKLDLSFSEGGTKLVIDVSEGGNE